MANLTIYGANTLLAGTPMPTTLWVQLHTGDPGPDGTSNLATDGRRRSFTRTTPAAGACTNAALLEWLAAPADESLTHISAWDADAAGACWWVGAITGGPAEAVTGQSTEIPLGDLGLSFVTWAG